MIGHIIGIVKNSPFRSALIGVLNYDEENSVLKYLPNNPAMPPELNVAFSETFEKKEEMIEEAKQKSLDTRTILKAEIEEWHHEQERPVAKVIFIFSINCF